MLGAVAAAGLAIDQAAKVAAAHWLAGRPPVEFLFGAVRFEFVLNKGAFLSFGASLPPTVRFALFVGLVSAFVVGAAGYALAAPRLRPAELAALSLIVTGGLGNLIDRLLLPGVRDFVSIGIGPLRTGIFNVADLLLVAGVFLLVPSLAPRAGGRDGP